jgi:hypothetical protein
LPQAAAVAASAAGVAATTNLTVLLPSLHSLTHNHIKTSKVIRPIAAWRDATNYCIAPRFMRCVLSFELRVTEQ